MIRTIIIIVNFAPSLELFRYNLIKELYKNNIRIIICSPNITPETLKLFSGINVELINISLKSTTINPFHDISIIINLSRIFKKFNPDAALFYTIKPVIYGSIAARITGIKQVFCVITGLGYTFENESLKQIFTGVIVKFLYRLSLKRITTVFFLNRDDKKTFDKFKLVPESLNKIILNGEGLDLNFYKSVPIKSNEIAFLLIARLIKDKGIKEYADAAKIIRNNYKNIRFQLLGYFYDSPNAITKKQVLDWENENIIDYLGETTDVRPYLANCTIYVLPSYREGTPRTVLEAMAIGRPVITTDAPGCRETIVDGYNGFLCQPKDVQSLVDAMLKFIHNPDIIPLMSERSRKLVEEKYDVLKVNKVILAAMGIN